VVCVCAPLLTLLRQPALGGRAQQPVALAEASASQQQQAPFFVHVSALNQAFRGERSYTITTTRQIGAETHHQDASLHAPAAPAPLSRAPAPTPCKKPERRRCKCGAGSGGPVIHYWRAKKKNWGRLEVLAACGVSERRPSRDARRTQRRRPAAAAGRALVATSGSGARGFDAGSWLGTKGRPKKNKQKTANVRTYFIWPRLNFCTRTMT
jgi:hypothetical protein